eukprot:3261781-Prymnesium_polylepis.1
MLPCACEERPGSRGPPAAARARHPTCREGLPGCPCASQTLPARARERPSRITYNLGRCAWLSLVRSIHATWLGFCSTMRQPYPRLEVLRQFPNVSLRLGASR